MSDTIIGKIVTSIILIVAVSILIFTDYGNQGKVYDCSFAEWHPDIPIEVKKECRKLRQEDWQRQQHIEKKNINT
jgi:hypothetical protein